MQARTALARWICVRWAPILLLGCVFSPSLTAQVPSHARSMSLEETFGRAGYSVSPSRASWTRDLRYLKGIGGAVLDPASGDVVPNAKVGERVDSRKARPARVRLKKGEIGGRAAPSGEWVAFVRDHNLYTRSLSDSGKGVERAVSTDGDKELLYGRLDWVYQEERRSEERRVGKECRSRWSPYH